MTPTVMKLLPALDKIGAVGAVLAAAAAPCCFPLLASVGAVLGLSFLKQFAPQLGYAIQTCVLVAVVGAFFEFRRHRQIYPLLLAAGGAIAVLAYSYPPAGSASVYSGMAALVGAGIWNTILSRRRLRIQYVSVLTCPHCGFKQEDRMPTDACQFFWECPSCHQRLKPKPGDCCVYCSYGSVPCPPIQAGRGCCA